MRWTIQFSILLGITLEVPAQWQHIPIDVPVGMGIWGPGSVNRIVMVAPGVGLCTTSVFYSPSSGSGNSIWRTGNEWLDYTGGAVQANWSFSSFEVVDTSTYFIGWYYQIAGLRSYSRSEDGLSVSYDYPVNPYYNPSAIEPIGDTVCIVSVRSSPSPLRIVRVTPHTTSVLDSINANPPTVKDIAFHDPSIGAVLVQWPDSSVAIRITQNGGASWSQAWIDSTATPVAMKWSDEQTLWVVGLNGFVMFTMDGGANWEVPSPPTTNDLRALDPCGSGCLWVGGDSGSVFLTQNQGLSWENRSFGSSPIYDVFAFSEMVYAVPWRNRLFKLSLSDPDDHSRAGTGDWWSCTMDGILLRTDEDESILGLALYDMSGRGVGARGSGESIFMRDLPGGLYIMDITTNKRRERGKILWPSYDR